MQGAVPGSGQSPCETVNILLVDDQPANLLVLEAVLGDMGQNLVRARSGEEALRLLEQQEFAVVLLDVRMPGLDGFETARIMRSRPETRTTPVIFISAQSGEEFPLIEAYKLGAVDYLVKPIAPEILRAKVAGFIEVTKERDRARREAEFLRLLIDSTRDYAIFMLDPRGIISTWNAGAERLKGYRADEIIGQHFSRFYPQDAIDRGWPTHELAVAVETGRFEDEGWRLRKGNNRYWANVVITTLRNDSGQVIGFSKVTRDLTERRASEENSRRLVVEQAARAAAEENALLAQRQEASLRFVADASRLLAEVTDVPSTLQKVASLAVPHFADWCAVDMVQDDGSVERMAVAHADPAKVELAHRLYREYPPDPSAPMGVPHILRTGQSEILEDISDSFLESTVKDAEMLRIVRELGLRSYIGVPLLLRGKAVGVLTFIGAESQRRFTQADLRVAENLAERAAVAIENARLYQQLKLADQRKDEFLAMLGHELRNPLAPIRTALQLMKMPEATPQMIADARDTSERQVQHMVRLVDDLLDVSRIMRGRIDIRREVVGLAEILRRGAEIAQPMLDAHGQHLLTALPDQPLYLEADPSRLAQVVSNLLHNAAKFSPRAGRIWLTLEQQGDQAVIRVKDEGAGIRPDLLPHIFDLFVQDDRTLERSQGGLGIGLTVVSRLVEMHGGTISATSGGLGLGAEFTITLPGLCAAPREAGSAPQEKAAGVSRRVLVVDDNVDSASMLGLLLKNSGHQVRLAHSGPAAITAAEDFLPELILLDIGLPGMNGYEVARRLRQQPRFNGTVLAALTGYGQETDRQRSEQAGFDLHYVKPLAPKTLEALVADPRGAVNRK